LPNAQQRDGLDFTLHPADHLVGMWRDEELFLVLTQEEAWELMSRCLNSVDPDNDVSKVVLRKLARILQCAQLETKDADKAA
jgi:hypothetical protein